MVESTLVSADAELGRLDDNLLDGDDMLLENNDGYSETKLNPFGFFSDNNDNVKQNSFLSSQGSLKSAKSSFFKSYRTKSNCIEIELLSKSGGTREADDWPRTANGRQQRKLHRNRA